MSILVNPPRQAPPVSQPPPLQSGDRLTQAEFHRRYLAHPELRKAELVEGVVYVPSPVSMQHHAMPHHMLATWIGVYMAATPGLAAADNATLQLDTDNEVQPDLCLFARGEHGGRVAITEDD